ncbi:MAG: glycerol kinase, partial [Deltaproteobacteria bacterium]|nr:glycerol kinase [Deltaproteobacteria bacterium]
MQKIIMALDQGTTSSRTILFNETGSIIASAGQDFPSYFPQSGWVEQKPSAIWLSQKETIIGVLNQAGLTMADITTIGITNQRETTIAWNSETGEAVGNAIVWQCRRTADYCKQLVEKGFNQTVRQKTGLVTDAYFSGTKMRWMLQNNDQAKSLAREGKLKFGTVDSWLIWHLTGGKKHVTDVSNASRTMIYNIFENQWDDEILNEFGIPREALPEVVASSGVVGLTDKQEWQSEVPIAGIAGDQHAALFGQTCFEPGSAKNTYGTGCFILLNTGEKPILSNNQLL